MDLMKEEGQSECYYFDELSLIVTVKSVDHSALPRLWDYHKELCEPLKPFKPELNLLNRIWLSKDDAKHIQGAPHKGLLSSFALEL